MCLKWAERKYLSIQPLCHFQSPGQVFQSIFSDMLHNADTHTRKHTYYTAQYSKVFHAFFNHNNGSKPSHNKHKHTADVRNVQRRKGRWQLGTVFVTVWDILAIFLVPT